MRMHPFLALALTMTLTPTLPAQFHAEAGTLPAGAYYRDPLVNRFMGLTPQQAEQLARITNQATVRFATDVDALGGLTVGDRVNRVQALRREYQAAWSQVAAELWYQNHRDQYEPYQRQYGLPSGRFMTPTRLSGYPYYYSRFQTFPPR